MIVTYIEHSCFLIETEAAYLLFDYYAGKQGLPALDSGKPLLVFESHSHRDHFSPDIFSLPACCPHTHFYLDSGIPVPSGLRAQCVPLTPHRTYALPEAGGQLFTLASNDLGVAFSIRIPEGGRDVFLYHAGDLNNWWWDGDQEDRRLEAFYHRELELIKGTHYLAAFIPLDPRLLGWWKGIDDFMKEADANYLFPMHNFGDFSMPQKLKALELSARYRDRIMDVQKPGQRWRIP